MWSGNFFLVISSVIVPDKHAKQNLAVNFFSNSHQRIRKRHRGSVISLLLRSENNFVLLNAKTIMKQLIHIYESLSWSSISNISQLLKINVTKGRHNKMLIGRGRGREGNWAFYIFISVALPIWDFFSKTGQFKIFLYVWSWSFFFLLAK